MTASGDGRVAVLAGKLAQRFAYLFEIPFDSLERLADLQHQSGVHYVLCRRAVMRPFAQAIGNCRDNFLDNRQDWCADDLRPLFITLKVDVC